MLTKQKAFITYFTSITNNLVSALLPVNDPHPIRIIAPGYSSYFCPSCSTKIKISAHPAKSKNSCMNAFQPFLRITFLSHNSQYAESNPNEGIYPAMWKRSRAVPNHTAGDLIILWGAGLSNNLKP